MFAVGPAVVLSINIYTSELGQSPLVPNFYHAEHFAAVSHLTRGDWRNWGAELRHSAGFGAFSRQWMMGFTGGAVSTVF